MTRPFRLTAPVAPEDSLHKTAADLLDRWLAPPACWTTFPAGGYALGPAAAGRLKRLGVKAGMPDILVWAYRRCVGIELKREREGSRSKSQRAMHPILEGAGVPVYVCRTPEAVLDALLKEAMPVRHAIIKAMLDRPYVRAERPVQENSHGREKQQGPEARRPAQPAQGAQPA